MSKPSEKPPAARVTRCPTCGRKHRRSNPANARYWLLLHAIPSYSAIWQAMYDAAPSVAPAPPYGYQKAMAKLETLAVPSMYPDLIPLLKMLTAAPAASAAPDVAALIAERDQLTTRLYSAVFFHGDPEKTGADYREAEAKWNAMQARAESAERTAAERGERLAAGCPHCGKELTHDAP